MTERDRRARRRGHDPVELEAELRFVAERFGVAAEQVRRDHLISHVLAALSQDLSDRVVFFGGTALSRTLFPEGRLSEDVDLLAVGERAETADRLRRCLDDRLARSHGALSWNPAPTATRGSEPALLSTDDGLSLKIQLLGAVGYPRWPTRSAELHQRYSDARPARLTTLTPEAFVAAKTTAWMDRATARDLFDLYLLADGGYVTAAAGRLFRRFGPTGELPPAWVFGDPPTPEVWTAQLAAQTRLTIGPKQALDVVRRAWNAAHAA